MAVERSFVLRCKSCGYEREIVDDEARAIAGMVDGNETGVVGGLDVIAEKLHHMNMFVGHRYGHGEFGVIGIPGSVEVGLLEVTRDFDALSYFYRSGKRK